MFSSLFCQRGLFPLSFSIQRVESQVTDIVNTMGFLRTALLSLLAIGVACEPLGYDLKERGYAKGSPDLHLPSKRGYAKGSPELKLDATNLMVGAREVVEREIEERQSSTPYWLENIAHQGVSAFGASGFQVFRNVKDFGAKGEL